MAQSMFSFVVVLCALQTCMVSSEGYDPKRTRLIDHSPVFSNGHQNFLFRGNEPTANKSFAYAELTASFRELAKNQSLLLPTEYVILDISLLNPTEISDETIESKFFKKNPQNGSVKNWIIVGSVGAPPVKHPERLAYMVKHLEDWNVDNLPSRMDDLRKMLLTPANVSTVMYIHCEAGTDRTGEVSGSYYMRWQNKTFAEAVYTDNHIQGRNMSVYSLNGLQWYCYYLNLVKNYTNVGCATV